jgi:xylulokinase
VARLLGGSHDRLGAAAARVAAGCDGVIFLPQMNGRILPEPNLDARASFSGIRRGTGREHLYRSVLEGNAFALRATREALLAQGLPAGDIYLTGGGTRSPLWRQILAGVFGTPVRWAGVEEGCRGGAIFAAVAAGAHGDVSTAMPAMTGRGHSLDPDATLMAYDEVYQRFLRVRDALDHV